jgi:uncharacterized protein (TIGR01244 family)
MTVIHQLIGRLLVTCLFAALSGCVTGSSGDPAVLPAPVTGKPAAFSRTAVKHHGQIFFSAQPDEDAFRAAAQAGVGLVINLREKNEFKGNDPMLARQAGLPYLNVPVSGRTPFEREAFERISTAVVQAKGPVWVYCSSGNRAAAWYVSHLILKQQTDQDDALAIGREVGMDRPEMQDRVLDYVNQQ